MDFADDSYYQPAMHLGLPAFAPVGATNLWSRDRQVRQQFEAPGSTHPPDVFTLPRDHDIAQQPMLTPCEDIEFLLSKFQRDVGAVMGIPEEMIRSQAHGGGGGGQETARKTMATGRIFSANMTEVCRHLQSLLASVYERIYGKANVEFVLLPMPRLEVESVEDMKVLFEIGAITPDMSLQLSQIMLGEDMENKRRRVQLEQEGVRRRKKEGKDQEESGAFGGKAKKDKEGGSGSGSDSSSDEEDDKKPKRTKPGVLRRDEVEAMKGKSNKDKDKPSKKK